MKILDPGHRYRLQRYPAQEEHGPCDPEMPLDVVFRKRVGPGYEPNTGSPYNGTTTQELLRVIINRSQYVDAQDHHKGT